MLYGTMTIVTKKLMVNYMIIICLSVIVWWFSLSFFIFDSLFVFHFFTHHSPLLNGIAQYHCVRSTRYHGFPCGICLSPSLCFQMAIPILIRLFFIGAIFEFIFKFTNFQILPLSPTFPPRVNLEALVCD